MWHVFVIFYNYYVDRKGENKNLDTLRKKINFFNKRIPDKYVFNYRNVYFNLKNLIIL